MRKLLVVLFTLFYLYIPVYAEKVRFIQVTDVHLTENNSQYLKDFVDRINQEYQNFDFIIFTGDNIDRANEKDLYTFLSIIKELKVRPYIIVGNHDLSRYQNMTNNKYMHIVQRKLGLYHSSKPNYTFKSGEIIFITMNGVKEFIPGQSGYYRNNELIWLDKKLTRYKNKKVVICQHFPLLNTNVLGHSLYKKDEYLKILKKHNNVIAVISGHYHENREDFENNIYQIVTKNFLNNQFYKIIEIEDGFIYTQLIYNNKQTEE